MKDDVGERTYKLARASRQSQRLMTLVRMVRVGICEAIADEGRLTPGQITSRNKKKLSEYAVDFKFDFVETRYDRYASDVIKDLAKDMFHYYRHGTTPHTVEEP